MVLAGRALTSHILPKISFLQAFVAGLTLVLIMTRPGKTNLPVLDTSLVPISARLFMIAVAADALISCSSAMAFAMELFVMALMGPFIVVFMGAMLKVDGGKSACRTSYGLG